MWHTWYITGVRLAFIWWVGTRRWRPTRSAWEPISLAWMTSWTGWVRQNFTPKCHTNDVTNNVTKVFTRIHKKPKCHTNWMQPLLFALAIKWSSKWTSLSNYAQHIIWLKLGSAQIICTKPIPVEIALGLNRFFLQRANIGWILELLQERLSLKNGLTKTKHSVWDFAVEKLPHFKTWSRFWKGSKKLFKSNDHILKR